MSSRVPTARFTLAGLLGTTALIALALAFFAAYDRFAILLMALLLGSVCFLGLVYPRRLFTKRLAAICGMVAMGTMIYLVSVVPAAWLVARYHTLDSGGRPVLLSAFGSIGGPAAECWIDAPMPIRALFMKSVNMGMPSNALLVEYPFGFGYTTRSASGGAAEVVLANFYRAGNHRVHLRAGAEWFGH